jgi:uncharacterized protein YbjT (DUF2867 family)
VCLTRHWVADKRKENLGPSPERSSRKTRPPRPGHSEQRPIGQRTRGALPVKRAIGVRLGRPSTVPPQVARRITLLRARGLSLRAIAENLNEAEVPTAQGGYAATVRHVLAQNVVDRLASATAPRGSLTVPLPREVVFGCRACLWARRLAGVRDWADTRCVGARREAAMNLVAGATGNVGGGVVEALRGQGKPVRAMVRETSSPERVQRLVALGAEVVRGELRDPDSLARACVGAATVVSGATTIGSLGTDSITAVDRDGQLSLVDAASSGGVAHFIYVSYTRHVDTDDPLTQAKRAVEERLRGSGMAFTILRPSYFMEMWLGPPLGWELAAGSARVLGSGEQRVSWISARDVVAAVVDCVDNPAARGQTIELGGPAAVSPLEVVRLAESIGGRPVAVEHVPVEALEQEARDAAGSDGSIFPSLMLCQTRGDEIEPAPDWLQPRTSVEDYLRGLLVPR